MNFKSLPLVALAGVCVILSSCSQAHKFYQAQSVAPPKPWEGTSAKWGGYQQKQQPGGGHRVTFTGYNEPDQKGCAYFCQVRAAELALLDGENFFFSAGARMTTTIEESNFPMRVIPGYMDQIPVIDYVSDSNGNVHAITTYRTVWVPPERIPPHTAINKINQATMTTNYSGGKKKYDTRAVLNSAHSRQSKLGKVRLDPRVSDLLKAGE